MSIVRAGFLLISLFFSLLFSKNTFAQDSIKYEAEIQGIVTTNHSTPFWMRSNQHGSIPLSGVSTSFIVGAHKDYVPYNASQFSNKQNNFDWGFGINARANVGDGSNISLIEGYGKVRYHIFQFTVGRTLDVMGLNGDSTLSSGNFSVSGNALGIPKAEISIPQYFTLPFWDKLIAIKGTFSFGFLDRALLVDTIRSEPPQTVKFAIANRNPETYLHQKSFYIRFGKPDWKLHLIGGFNHEVAYGSERDYYGKYFDLSGVKEFYYVVVGKTYGNGYVPDSKIGNQLGSIDLGFEYSFESVKLTGYRQNLYDVGALAKLANIADGLNGITLENKKPKTHHKGFHWDKILLEFLYTKNQAGGLNAIYTPSGDEDYYNNSEYLNGWTYYNNTIGTPFITSEKFAKKGQAHYLSDYYVNNRVEALHLGVIMSIKDVYFIGKISYSENYGTYGTSPEGHSTGLLRYPPTKGLFTKVSETSAYLEAKKNMTHHLTVGLVAAADYGGLLDNSTGFLIKLHKSF